MSMRFVIANVLLLMVGFAPVVEAQKLELAKSGDPVSEATSTLPKLTVADSKVGQPEKKAG